jgi:hypothetical protein
LVRVMPLLDDDDEPVPSACTAATQALSLVQTPQVGPSNPEVHCRAHPVLALPARTAENGCLYAFSRSGLSHVGVTQPLSGENPGGQLQVPLLRSEP